MSLLICEILGYLVQFVNRNELTGYLKCDVKKHKTTITLDIPPKNFTSYFLRNLTKYRLVIITGDKVNVYCDISI